MRWRTLIITKPCKLSLQNRQLLVEGEENINVPLEDISAMVLETPQAVVTSALISALPAFGIVLVACDECHLPNGLLLPFMPYSRQLATVRKQINAPLPLQKRLWQKIVVAKINNQALCLDFAGAEGGDYLRALAKTVNSGDSENREGQAAQFYFPRLWGEGFTRQLMVWHNGALNYGYAVLRACIARSLAVGGFVPALGIHHRNELNAFNLADDLIEPFRPLVDWWVWKIGAQSNIGDTLSPADKARLVAVLYQDLFFPVSHHPQANETMNALTAVEGAVDSLARAWDKGKAELLLLPQLMPPKP